MRPQSLTAILSNASMSVPQGTAVHLFDVIDGSESNRHLVSLLLGFVDSIFGDPGWSLDVDRLVCSARTAHSWIYCRFDSVLLDERSQ